MLPSHLSALVREGEKKERETSERAAGRETKERRDRGDCGLSGWVGVCKYSSVRFCKSKAQLSAGLASEGGEMG